jgi:hypothetical protein
MNEPVALIHHATTVAWQGRPPKYQTEGTTRPSSLFYDFSCKEQTEPIRVMGRDCSDVPFSSQPGSSQSQRCDDPMEMVDRAFWQSTPTTLQELREGTDSEKEMLHRTARVLQFLVVFSS